MDTKHLSPEIEAVLARNVEFFARIESMVADATPRAAGLVLYELINSREDIQASFVETLMRIDLPGAPPIVGDVGFDPDKDRICNPELSAEYVGDDILAYTILLSRCVAMCGGRDIVDVALVLIHGVCAARSTAEGFDRAAHEFETSARSVPLRKKLIAISGVRAQAPALTTIEVYRA